MSLLFMEYFIHQHTHTYFLAVESMGMAPMIPHPSHTFCLLAFAAPALPLPPPPCVFLHLFPSFFAPLSLDNGIRVFSRCGLFPSLGGTEPRLSKPSFLWTKLPMS
eukprot:Opistho-2@63777